MLSLFLFGEGLFAFSASVAGTVFLIVRGIFELTPVRDGEQLGSLLIGHVDDFDGMVVKTSDTSGLDAFVAVDNRSILSNDGEAPGVLVPVAGTAGVRRQPAIRLVSVV